MTSRTVKTAIVTGAAGAIGNATAREFAEQGWRILGVDRREPEDAEPFGDFVVCDVTASDLPSKLLAHPLVDHRLDALVNNAAVQVDLPLVDTSDDVWAEVLDVNLTAAFRLIRDLHPALAAARGGIVNVSSVHAVATSINVAAYAVSKAALAGLTRTTALELATAGVRCNAVLPGAVMSDMLRAGLDRRPHPDGPDGNLANLVARTPLGFVAEPADIAPTIVFLADTRRSPYTTGQTLILDGGATARLSTE